MAFKDSTRIYEIIRSDVCTIENLISRIDIGEKVFQICKTLINCIYKNNKILICGNGGSAADAQHFAAELVGRFQKQSIDLPLPAIALTTDTSIITAIGNDYGFESIFSKQIEAIGQKGDVLIAISTSGQSKNIIKAINTAIQKDIYVILLSGRTDLVLFNEQSIHLELEFEHTAILQECFLILEHIICEVIDEQFRAC